VRDITFAGNHADHRNMSAEARCSHRTRQRSCPADLDHMIDATLVCQAQNNAVPIFMLAIVNDLVCANLLSSLKFFVRARCNDRPRTRKLCKLECHHRYAAGSLKQNRFTFFQTTGHH